jgi:hypothetical protein
MKVPLSAVHQIFGLHGWSICYHGTNVQYVPNILKYGLLIQGGSAHTLHGHRLGRRIYSSPFPLYAAQDRYAVPKCLKGKWTKVVFMCRAKPGTMEVSKGKKVWTFVSTDHIKITAVLFKRYGHCDRPTVLQETDDCSKLPIDECCNYKASPSSDLPGRCLQASVRSTTASTSRIQPVYRETTLAPTPAPTYAPTPAPTYAPTAAPTYAPTYPPTYPPTYTTITYTTTVTQGSWFHLPFFGRRLQPMHTNESDLVTTYDAHGAQPTTRRLVDKHTYEEKVCVSAGLAGRRTFWGSGDYTWGGWIDGCA